MWPSHAGRFGRQALLKGSGVLAAALLTWNLAVYTITAIAQKSQLPQVLQSIGFFMFLGPPPVFLSLLGQLLAVAAVAGLANQQATTRRLSEAVDTVGGSPSPTATDRSPLVESADAGGDASGYLQWLMRRWSTSTATAVYYACFAAVPATWLFLGVQGMDVLHAGYLVWLLVWYLHTDLRLVPAPLAQSAWRVALQGGPTAGRTLAAFSHAPSPIRHRLIRTYASFHLLAMYLAMCGQLPGLGGLQVRGIRPACSSQNSLPNFQLCF